MNRLRLPMLMVGATLVVLSLPVVTRPADTPRPVRPKIQTIALDGATRALPTAATATAGRRADTGPLTTEPFRLMGVSWDEDEVGEPPEILVRLRRGEAWSAWQRLEPIDQAPDAGTNDAESSSKSTEPLWVDHADGVQVRVDNPANQLPTGLRVELVHPGSSEADRRLGQDDVLGGRGASLEAVPIGPTIVSRAQWGADEGLRRQRCQSGPEYGRTVRMGFVHHTATTNNYRASDSAAIVRAIYAYHTQTNGWCDIGYNFLVDKYGRIFEGRFGGVDRPVIGAHTGGFNTDTFGVAIMGTYTGTPPSTDLLKSAQHLLAWKLGGNYRDPKGMVQLTSRCEGSCKHPYGRVVTFNVVSGHRDATHTTCPGDAAYARLGAVRDGAAAMLGSIATPIYSHWQRHGGESGWIGSPFILEHNVPGGNATAFRSARIYDSSSTPAKEVHGAILAKYLRKGATGSPLRFPTTDESSAANGGRYNFFQGGAIFWRSDIGAHEVHGDIYVKWSQFNREWGLLGYPLTDERSVANGGRANRFERGHIFWSNVTGAHELHGAIRHEYLRLGGPRSCLGFPVTDEQNAPGGRQNLFQFGRIYWEAGTGKLSVTCPGASAIPGT